VLFGELFRAAGWNREDTVVSNKLWWEFWPEQSAAAELDGSLARMGFDHVDLIYANPPPDDLPLPEMVAAVSELGTTPAALAVAFALANPAVTSVLLGATSPAQIEQNVAALELDPRVVLQALEV
jgi:aryl-alcohol dehydrogenase-like predicted oxidoreductase